MVSALALIIEVNQRRAVSTDTGDRVRVQLTGTHFPTPEGLRDGRLSWP